MTLDKKDKKALSDIRMSKAREFLADADANVKDKRFRSSVNRAYYAALNAVRALLVVEGINPETHEGAVTMLSLRFVKTGMLPVDVMKGFKTLLSRRAEVDYGDFDTIGNAEAEDSLKSAGFIIETIDILRNNLLAELYKEG